MIYGLPTSLEIGGRSYDIRCDFREVLEIIGIMNDVELEGGERAFVTLLFFYPDFAEMPSKDYQEAIEKCYWFISGGKDEHPEENTPMLMDWEQDFPYIIAPVNRVIGHEIRADKHLHWWTFLAAYMEIGECTFSQIIHIRDMQKRGKKLDQSDREWYARNRDIVDLKTKYTTTEEDLLKKWGGDNG